MTTPVTDNSNPLANIDQGGEGQRPSPLVIYDSIMRGGGEPFGRPFDVGTATLTVRIVRMFKQLGFFAFETFDPPRARSLINKFTRYGASRFRGPFDPKAKP